VPLDLGHVRWLGGATGAGKTTVARRLVERYRLSWYDTDAAIAQHSRGPGPDAPLLGRFLSQDMDERWLRSEPSAMLRDFPWFEGERFDLVVRDLTAMPRSPVVLAEGYRLPPRLVRPLVAERGQAVWLVTTPERRRAAFEARPVEQQFWRRTSDPSAAFELLLQRDALFDERVRHEVGELGLPLVEVTGATPVDGLVDEVASLLRL
jgi:hypothetical protein